MLSHAAAGNRDFADQASFIPFELAFELVEEGWLDRISGANCVGSSLALHHLLGGEKRQFSDQIVGRLSPTGAL